MSLDLNGSGGTSAADPSGTVDPAAASAGAAAASGTPAGTSQDTVKYESYKKLLDEKKKRDAEVDQLRKEKADFEASQKAEAERKLVEKEDWKKLVALREQTLEEIRKENETLKSEISEGKARRNNGLKMRALLDNLSGTLDEQYWALVDLDKVVIDPDTGMPDPTSVQVVAKEFETKFPLVIQKKSAAKLPSDAPRGGSAKLSYDAWIGLPYKEKITRQKDVDPATIPAN